MNVRAWGGRGEERGGGVRGRGQESIILSTKGGAAVKVREPVK